ncbi:uncharacterized protein LOC122404045 [Colletes gigas]|uniref:uncharacterized protein LOC122404045 n=1 Tax=Colletes gigas TaxID=935657 RepID=UPI001C9B8CFD|nr:uncharacterized protein LOC122404045 [Colletes gigas]
MGEVIRVSGRAPDVGEFLKEAMLSQRFADVALCCPGGQKFLAHRLVLSAASPYLQEVLLAHSKTSGHCEPITVILAEVEAPELAAILGFVYTGTATVPRPRLNAFLRAAEALHIRLPPVPVVMTCAQPHCNHEDIKDVKINPKYLRCEQYPCCDGWYRPTGPDQDDGGPASKEEPPYPAIESLVAAREIGPLPESMNFAGPRYGPGRYCSTTWPVPAFVNASQEKIVRGADRTSDNERTNQTDVRRYRPASMAPRIDRITEPSDSNAERSPVKAQQEFCFTRCPYKVHGDLDPLELRIRNDETCTGINADDETVQEDRGHRFTVIRSGIGSCQSGGTASLESSGRTRSLDKSDYGEDLTCGESCYGWKTPKRHVANRVIASPWRQTVRPYHLPKLQPIVLQPHADHVEIGESQRPPEAAARPVATSGSPDRQPSKNTVSIDHYYGFQVPISNNGPRLLDPGVVPDTRHQEFYSSQMIPFIATTAQTTVPTINNDVGSNETLLQPQNNAVSTTTRSLLTNDNENVNRQAGYFGQVVPHPPQKPEISHPVSRLCDTIEPDVKNDCFASLGTERPETEQRNEEKLAERLVVNSDNNNNDSIVGNDVLRRGRPAGGEENHRCDQCGKIFVTRASLKVHVRTHSGEKPFRCADCGKQFSQLRNYKYHRSVHEGTREFAATCPECGKYFNDRGYLSSHMKIHRNRKEYGCQECGKSFNQRVAYNMHVRIHTGVKPHQCEQCGKAFSRKMLLKQHLRTHSGERPYQCQVCQKAFADRSNMTLHTRLHSGLKPYQCTLCSKAFTKKHHLKTHLNYHTGTKPYSCPNCGLRFSQSSNMRTHFKKCTVNNPVEAKNTQTDAVAVAVAVAAAAAAAAVVGTESSRVVQTRMISRTPTDALTPPNSDQELSILTPISKTNDGTCT